jgi:hypothetical protein
VAYALFVSQQHKSPLDIQRGSALCAAPFEGSTVFALWAFSWIARAPHVSRGAVSALFEYLLALNLAVDEESVVEAEVAEAARGTSR